MKEETRSVNDLMIRTSEFLNHFTHGKWCKSIEKNTPELKFGSNVDIDVLNLNPRIRIEILWRFYKIQDGGQDGRQTHFDTYLHF